jgi:hypothetical protein
MELPQADWQGDIQDATLNPQPHGEMPGTFIVIVIVIVCSLYGSLFQLDGVFFAGP